MSTYQSLLFDRSFINGEWTTGSQVTFDVKNPADLSVVASLYDEDRQGLATAVEAAHSALKSWKAKSAKERSAILFQWYHLILQHKDQIAEIMTLESGKPLAESQSEVEYGASYIQWFGEEAKRNYGDIIPGFAADNRVMTVKEPVGVVATITPWNFPIAMITRKVAPALAVGCTVVIRPSEETPLTALAITHLAQLAGFPDGVINTVVGSNASEMGKELCAHKKIAKISFTGSTRVGKMLMQQSADTLKKLSLELGGNAPFIVFEDADLELAVKGAVAAKFRFGGQTCVCANRFLVQQSVYEKFVEKFTTAVRKLQLGNGMEPEVNIGPLINGSAIARMKDMTKDALSKGGQVVTGGHAHPPQFFEPTIIRDATSEMSFAQEEIFGPIAPIFSFHTEEEAIHMANDTIYGLASYLYTNDLNRSWRVREQLEYGIVGINEGLISSEIVPFGGMKYSGQGREGSKYGLDAYVDIKYVCIGNVR